MGKRPARKRQGRGAVVHGTPAAAGGQPHPHFPVSTAHAPAATPARNTISSQMKRYSYHSIQRVVPAQKKTCE